MKTVNIKWARDFHVMLLLLILSWPGLCPAQTASTGALTGTISDQSGAIVPGAEITARNEATGTTSSAVSQDDGRYTVVLLPPGTYRVEFKKNGFSVAVAPEIRINVTETARFDVTMTVGALTQNVTVEAAPNMVQTESSTLGHVVNDRAIEGLPLDTRNYTQIIGLSPGVEAPVTNASELGRGSGGVSPTQGTSGLSVNGGRTYDSNYQINGISVNDNQATTGSGGVPIPNSDTIEEFKVQTGLYDAAFGHNAGANVDIVTKGGSNAFHGSLFEFFRNEDLNANDFFRNSTGQPRPILRQNQFGFVLGGPILKEKLLFFASYQGTRQLNGASNSVSATCENSVFSPPLTNDRSPAALGALFAGQAGAEGGVAVAPDGSNISPAALALLNFKLSNGSFLIPTPQVIRNGQGFSAFSEACKFNEDQFMTNMDYLQSSKSKISARFFFANSLETITFPVSTVFGPGNTPGFPEDINGNFRVFSLAHTYTISPRLLNEARLGFNRILGNLDATSPYTFSDVGISEGVPSNNLPAVDIAGSFNLNPGFPFQFAQNSYSFQDSLSYAHGRHTMRFGGGLTRLQNNISDFNFGGSLEFLSFPDFLLGQSAAQNGSGFSNVFSSIDGFGEYSRAYRSWEGALFYQDDIKVTSRFTVNAGLRYERIGLYNDIGGRNAAFNTALANPNPPASGSIAGYEVASNFKGIVPPGVTQASNPYALAGDRQNTWGPRLGFSWQVLPQTSRFVLRGGYGIYYSRPTGEAFIDNVVGAPFAQIRENIGTVNAAATFANPFPPPPASFPAFPAYSPTTAISAAGSAQDFAPAIVQQYSLNLQTSIAKNFLLEVGYVGETSTHLLRTRSADQALSASPSDPIRGITTNTVANIAQREPILGFGPDSLQQVESAGFSRYNALDVSLTKRFSNGLQFLSSYTFSKTLDTDGAETNLTAAANGITIGNQNDPRSRYGPTDYSRPHRFTFAGVYDLPRPKTEAGFAGHLLGGWELAGVLTIQAGQQITILDTNANNVFGISEDRAQIVAGCTKGQLVTPGSVTSKLTDYFNTACFATPPVIGSDGIGTAFGDSGTGIVRGPAQQNVDFAFIKRTEIGKWPSEATNLEFRVELFNAFNTAQFSNPDNSLSDGPAFGQISTTSVSPRIVQLALKLNF
jgi:hypothetical protein